MPRLDTHEFYCSLL